MCLSLNDFFTSVRPQNSTAASDVADGGDIAEKSAASTSADRSSDAPSTSADRPLESVAGSSSKRKCDSDILSYVPNKISKQIGSKSKLTWHLKKGLASAKDYVILNSNNHYKSLVSFIIAALSVVNDILKEQMEVYTSLKYNVVLEAVFVHPEGMKDTFNFKTKTRSLYPDDESGLQENLASDGEKLL